MQIHNQTKFYSVDMLATMPKFRRKGITRKLYDYIINHIGPLSSGTMQTPSSIELWKSIYRSNRYNIQLYNKDSNHFEPVIYHEDKFYNTNGDPVHGYLGYNFRNIYILVAKKKS